MKLTAVNFDTKNSVTLTVDVTSLVGCRTQDEVKKALEQMILESRIFHESDLPKLKYQGRKEIIAEWEVLRQTTAEDTPQYDLDRFLDAQALAYPVALEEMQNGMKTSHWIWFIFPQQKGLGHSYNSEFYGLDGIDEARAYLAHPILGQRLREISQVLLTHKGKNIRHIMGSHIDALKLETSMRLFDAISPNDIFNKVLQAFF